MEESKIKLYAASIMAFMMFDNLDDQAKQTPYWAHQPALIQSTSIENAALEARHLAYERWSTAEGYSHHNAVITPVTRDFLGFMQQMSSLGLFTSYDTSREQTQTFLFDKENLRTADFDNSSFVDGH